MKQKKPNGFWTVEKAHEQALGFETRNDFQNGSRGAYMYALKNKFLDIICSHMSSISKPKNYWTLDKIQEVAIKFNTKSEFKKNNPSAYSAMLKNKWTEIVCSHMIILQQVCGYWDIKERVLTEALKYQNRRAFMKGSYTAYKYAHKNKWIEEASAHMIKGAIKVAHWNIKENVFAEAMKYEKKMDFTSKSNGAYEGAVRNGWIDEINEKLDGKIRWNYELTKEQFLKYNSISDLQKSCPSAYQWAKKNGFFEEFISHMIPLGSLEKRYVYKATFPDSSIYIGLTCDIKRRKRDHLAYEDSAIYKYAIKTKTEPIFELLSDLLSNEEASKLERKLISKYKKSDINILNRAEGGGLGSGRKIWTFENLQKEALKYNSKKEFKIANAGAYSAAYKNKWFDDLCGHMTFKRKPNGYWTFDLIQIEALKYSSRKDFSEGNGSAYCLALKRKWMNQVCQHMEWNSTKPNPNNKQLLLQ